jgi:small subunit ribosomal protein S15
MVLSKSQVQATVVEFGQSEQNSGNITVQIALLTARIKELTQHLIKNPKDFACRRGLVKLVGDRRRKMRYFKRQSTPEVYAALLSRLELRK